MNDFFDRLVFYFRNRYSIYYSASPSLPNFGDQLSLDVVNYFSRRNYRKASFEYATLIAIGSILELFLLKKGENFQQKPMRVWGAGFMAEEGRHHRIGSLAEYKFARPMKFAAVRGYHTLCRIQSMGCDNGTVTVGDPGILASYLVNNAREVKEFRLGIIPHYIDRDNPIIQQIQKKVKDTVILDILESPRCFLEKMLQCETILSSAMHGLIAADSYGIPNRWIKVSDKIHGEDYKYRDYYSVYAVKAKPLAIDTILEHSKNIVSLINDEYEVSSKKVTEIKNNLIKCKPFK